MSLYLYELVPTTADRGGAESAIKYLDGRIRDAGGDLIETQVAAGATRVFAIAEFSGCRAADLTGGADEAGTITGPHQVRLVGAELSDIKAVRPTAGYLVEWDLPAALDMESYLARKKANAPRYAQVPEVSFLRTYVREDMDKCLCFYDAPDESAVLRAREAVSTPVDRVHALER